MIAQQNIEVEQWVTVGMAQPINQGMLVVLSSLDWSKGTTARFAANLAIWCIHETDHQ